jgi:Spy/CpxP family protein refolding chaperone
MRTLAMASAVLALVAVPAHAQMGGGGKRGHKADDTAKTDDQKAKAKADDKAYQEALKRIPDPKEKYDPWAVAKPSDVDKKPSK